MRITGGEFSGRIIKAPEGLLTRPTSDKTRTALFNMLVHHDWTETCFDIEDAIVLDAFAGTGALAFESLSRGAQHAYCFENAIAAQKVLRGNRASLALEENCDILSMDVTRPPAATAVCSLIFLDPPYHKGLIPLALTALTKKGWIHPQALIVCETAKKEEIDLSGSFRTLHEKSYGDTTLHFLTPIK